MTKWLEDEDEMILRFNQQEDDTEEEYRNFRALLQEEALSSYKEYPECEKRWCWKCGHLLKASSVNWELFFHIDGCE